MELSEEQKKQLEEQKAQCPFCQIIAGKIPAQKVYEDDKVVAILDINPAKEGHILIMTKEHYPILPLLPKDEFEQLILRTKDVTEKVKKAIVLTDSSNIFIANGGAAGQQAPHFMIHILPRQKGDKMDNFKLKEKDIKDDDTKKIKQTLAQSLPKMMGERFEKYKMESQEIEQQSITKEKIFEILEENPKLKELVKADPKQAKELIQNNEKLNFIFSNFNVDKISEELNHEQKSDEDNNSTETEKKDNNQKDEANLDEISKLF